jgi:hypothetical protein
MKQNDHFGTEKLDIVSSLLSLNSYNRDRHNQV